MPALAGIRLQPSFNVKAAGPLDRLGVEMNVQSSAGLLSGTVVADLMAPGQSVAGDVSVKHLDLSPLLNDPAQKSDITANARVDLHGEALSNVNALHGHGVARLAAPRRRRLRGGADPREGAHRRTARGARRQRGGLRRRGDRRRRRDAAGPRKATGRLRRPRPGAHVDLRQLPRELNVRRRRTPNVNAAYHVGRGAPAADGQARRHINGDLRFEPSTIAGAKIAAGSTAGFSVNGKDIGYKADATVADLDLQRIGDRVQRAGARHRSLQELDQRSHRGGRPRHDAEGDGRDGERHADRHVDPRRHDSAARPSTPPWRATPRTSRRTAASPASIRRWRAASRR